MRRPSKYTTVTPLSGATRLKRVFSFWPTLIQDQVVWLEFYEILQAYVEAGYLLKIEGEKRAFKVGEWKDIDKRVINQTVNVSNLPKDK